MDFKPGRGRKVAFWRALAEAEGLPEPKSPEDYGELFERWDLYGPADEEYIVALRRHGYKMVNQDPQHCVCGARIQYAWVIVNHASKLFAFIGSECKEKFGVPPLSSRHVALSFATSILLKQIRELRRFGIKPKKQLRLLGKVIYYREKMTIYKGSVIVSKTFAEELKLLTGIEWKWKTWEDLPRKEKTASRQI